MLVINLWGGPGAGKSTVAAEVFSRLRHGTSANVELVNEFATELCFERAKENLKDQIYLLGNQWHRLWRLDQLGVQVAVNDSPLGLGIGYHGFKGKACEHLPYKKEYDDLTKALMTVYPTYNVFIHRDVYAEGGFKGNTKKKAGSSWIHALDGQIQRIADPNFVLTYSDKAGKEVTQMVIDHNRGFFEEIDNAKTG